MTTQTYTNDFVQVKPTTYLVYLIVDKHVSWEFCMRVLKDVFYRDEETAAIITNEILTNGEGLCGAYMYEIAESKADIVKELAKKEEFSIDFFLEDV